jgi:hypothetical protein
VVKPFNGITTTTLDNLISNSNTDIKNDKKNNFKICTGSLPLKTNGPNTITNTNDNINIPTFDKNMARLN